MRWRRPVSPACEESTRCATSFCRCRFSWTVTWDALATVRTDWTLSAKRRRPPRKNLPETDESGPTPLLHEGRGFESTVRVGENTGAS
jgi:hypothetical protein